jgi:SAM-dependent methyltransferase
MPPANPVPARARSEPESPPHPFPDIPFKDRMRHEWDAVAEDWAGDRWFPLVERSAQTCNDRLVELADLGPGDRVLDLGTGIGEPAATAARRVAPDGRVLGIDLAPAMIREGRRRIERLGLSNVELEVADIEELDLEPASFDAVLSRWTLMMMEDLGTALADLHRFLVPGGRLAVGLWGHPRRVPMVTAALGTALELLRIPAPPPEEPNHLWTQGSDALEKLALTAGFSEVQTETMDLVFDLPSPEFYAEFVYSMAGPVRVLVDLQPEPVARELFEAFAEAARSFCRPDGTVRFVNETILLTGRRPVPAAVA